MHNQIIVPPRPPGAVPRNSVKLRPQRADTADPAFEASNDAGAPLSPAERERLRGLTNSYAGSNADDTDQVLVARAQEGDMRAFELLLRKYQHRVAKLVGRLVGEADAADVAQETFFKAYRALPGFRGQSSFYTWIYRIGLNTARNHLAWRGRRPASQDIDVEDAWYDHAGHLSHNETPESVALSEEIRNQLVEVIGRLPPDLRRAITLREFDGLSYEEIAQVLRCPIGTVRSRIFRAREAVDHAVGHLLS